MQRHQRDSNARVKRKKACKAEFSTLGKQATTREDPEIATIVTTMARGEQPQYRCRKSTITTSLPEGREGA